MQRQPAGHFLPAERDEGGGGDQPHGRNPLRNEADLLPGPDCPGAEDLPVKVEMGITGKTDGTGHRVCSVCFFCLRKEQAENRSISDMEGGKKEGGPKMEDGQAKIAADRRAKAKNDENPAKEPGKSGEHIHIFHRKRKKLCKTGNLL